MQVSIALFQLPSSSRAKQYLVSTIIIRAELSNTNDNNNNGKATFINYGV